MELIEEIHKTSQNPKMQMILSFESFQILTAMWLSIGLTVSAMPLKH